MKESLILGPPGCGKTTECMNIMERELAAGVKPDKILYSTFTKRGANEAILRACEKFKFKRDQLPYFRTLHSLFFQELHIGREDVMQTRDYKIIGESLGLDFGYVDMMEGMPVPTANRGDNMLYLYGLSRSKLIEPEEQFKDSDFDFTLFEFDRFIRTLHAYKNSKGLVDFSDMVDLYIAAGKPLNIEVAIIDEAQDLSKQQWRAAKIAYANAKRFYGAGDDDQAIFKWSGADVDSFLALKGEKKVLNHSYRLPRQIFQLAEKITKTISHRFAKDWEPRDDEGSVEYINSVGDLEVREGTNLWLARNKYMLKMYEEHLRSEGFAYTNAMGSSIDHDAVTAIQAWEALRRGAAVKVEFIRMALTYLKVGSGIKRGCKSLKGAPAELTIHDLCSDWGLLTMDIWHDAFVGMDESPYYLAVLRRGESLTNPPRVHVSTIHSVKGGEADHVVILSDISWKTFESYRDTPDDEHRVFYVAATRARHTLQILMPQTNIYYDFP